MKGLLLKDLYLIRKYCRAFLLIIVVFFGIFLMNRAYGLSSGTDFFLLVYPGILAGLVPSSLFSYDERDKWDIYSATLPCSRTQLVSCKYCLGLAVVLPVVLIAAGLNALTLAWGLMLSLSSVVAMAAILLLLGLAGPAVILPFMFRFGAEKGRIAYFSVIVLLCAAGGMISALFPDAGNRWEAWLAPDVGVSLALAAAAVLLYAASWRLSAVFYGKREL